MYKIFAASLLSLALCAPAFAAPNVKGGGFQGPTMGKAEVGTVAEAKKASDDTHCVLEGNIIANRPQHERYVFQDKTGQIDVKVDDELFAGRTITPKDTVRLFGEVDREMFEEPEIDVDAIEIINR